jgi:hypothetical protein
MILLFNNNSVEKKILPPDFTQKQKKHSFLRLDFFFLCLLLYRVGMNTTPSSSSPPEAKEAKEALLFERQTLSVLKRELESLPSSSSSSKNTNGNDANNNRKV